MNFLGGLFGGKAADKAAAKLPEGHEDDVQVDPKEGVSKAGTYQVIVKVLTRIPTWERRWATAPFPHRRAFTANNILAKVLSMPVHLLQVASEFRIAFFFFFIFLIAYMRCKPRQGNLRLQLLKNIMRYCARNNMLCCFCLSLSNDARLKLGGGVVPFCCTSSPLTSGIALLPSL